MYDIEKALAYAKEKHEGQKRKDGSAYIFHPMKVAEMCADLGEEYYLAGLFHDLLEDTDAREEEILALAGPGVLEAVKLLTKTKGYDEEEYIRNILKNPVAKAVKNADRIHNLKDALHADAAFIRRYLKDTEHNYLGRFSEELDEAYRELKKYMEDHSPERI